MNIYFDMHTHTVASGHAFSTFKENVEEAAGKGLFALGMSDHAPAMPGSAPSIYFSNFKCFRQEVMGVRIFTGVEANIMDFNGNLDLDETVLRKGGLCNCQSPHTLYQAWNSKREHGRFNWSNEESVC